MKIDVVSIFPQYFAPLELSLIGKAQARGLLEVAVHDLRSWAEPPHHKVDDTPYGGGAGLVMIPTVWGKALDAVADIDSVIVVPTPAGVPFTQQHAHRLAQASSIVMLCGRYEGIDQRVIDEAAAHWPVMELSLGDYVLNGGEVAALAMIEATVRLLPGFMGNEASLTEESHVHGLLEYPVFTKPSQWRGRSVPAVLRSGDHQAIAAWRRAQAVARTVERRPDLLSPQVAGSLTARLADAGETGAVWSLAHAARSLRLAAIESQAHPAPSAAALHVPKLPPLPTLTALGSTIAAADCLVVERGGRIVAAALLAPQQPERVIELWVAPDQDAQEVVPPLLTAAEARLGPDIRSWWLNRNTTTKLAAADVRRWGFRPSGEASQAQWWRKTR